MKTIYLIRHGETKWALTGQHTGLTDIPLTENGKRQSQSLAKRLKTVHFETVLVSPLQRSLETCRIAGCGDKAIVEPLLVEWNYGKYEGLKRREIEQESLDWDVFLNGAPGGESVSDVEKRCAQVLLSVQKIRGNVALFSHGHFLRALTACYIQLTVAEGRHFTLSPASLSLLTYENDFPVISLWNDISHL
jgi:broad specificity phosphatase PhoE